MYAGWEWELSVQEARARVAEDGPRTAEKPEGSLLSGEEEQENDYALVLYTAYHKSDGVEHGWKSLVNVPQ